jgi:hypothetical protein
MPPHVSRSWNEGRLGATYDPQRLLLMLKAIEHAFAGAALLQASTIFTIVATGLMRSPETLEQLDCASQERNGRLSLERMSLEVFKSGSDQCENTLSQLITS